MPVFQSKELISRLKHDTQLILDKVRSLKGEDSQVLNQQPAPDSWSIAQILEHLNFYSRFYNTKLQELLPKAKNRSPEFRSGWLGNYFTKMMLPKENGTVANKMSAMKEARPEAQLDSAAVVDEFISHQEQLLQLLETGAVKDLSVRIPTSISSLIKMKAGDTFRFLIAHQQRHMAQAVRAAKAIGYNW